MPQKPARYTPFRSPRLSPSEAARPTAARRGYGSSWQRLRAVVLNAEPLCRSCRARGLVVEAVHVDHVVAKEKGGTDDLSNLRPLCASCHSKKTVAEDGGFGRTKK